MAGKAAETELDDAGAASPDEADTAGALRWCDSHCHLEESMAGGMDGAVARAHAAGVGLMVTVGTDAARSAAAIETARRFDSVVATVGLHPHDASAGVASILPLLEGDRADRRSRRIVAIGECGLDYHYDYSPRAVQRQAFAEQVALAQQLDLPLVVHTREAWDDTFAVFGTEGVPATTIFHCFTGGPLEAERCLQLGAYLSFSGIVTFKNASDVREAAQRCPLERLLIETDAPYLAPVPHRGRPNEPSLVPLVGEAVAATKGVTVGTVAAQSLNNAVVAFTLASS